jgi:hypothetical protein
MYWGCCTSFPPKLKERSWKIRLTKVNAGNLKHELLNRLWSILAVNVLINIVHLLNKINEIQGGTKINNQSYYTNVMQKSCP